MRFLKIVFSTRVVKIISCKAGHILYIYNTEGYPFYIINMRRRSDRLITMVKLLMLAPDKTKINNWIGNTGSKTLSL